jgi:single-strand DNA-binding protein
MSFTYNRVTLLGRAAAPPETRLTTGGRRVTTFSVATDRPARPGSTPTTDWHRVVCWDKLAEIAVEHVSKGRLLFIEGAITYRSWEDQQSQKHSVTEIVARELILLDRPSDASAWTPGNRTRTAPVRRDARDPTTS